MDDWKQLNMFNMFNRTDHITLYDETSVTYIKTEKIILISVVRINYESFK